MPLIEIDAPIAEPVGLAEAKLHLKQDVDDEDLLIEALISAAREAAETDTQCNFVSRRWKLVLDRFPSGGCISLPKGPLLKIVSIRYLDLSDTWQTMDADQYTVGYGAIPEIAPKFGKIWPIAKPELSSVEIIFDAGFIAPATFDPENDQVFITGYKALTVGDAVQFYNAGGEIARPIVARRKYYVQAVVSDGVYRITEQPGGAVLNILSAGKDGGFFAGVLPASVHTWMLLRIDTMWTHRGENAVVKGAIQRLGYVDSLLDSVRVMRA